jgi:CelD/BcsL family acetyltransferase involved in cellulose biosynthesis
MDAIAVPAGVSLAEETAAGAGVKSRALTTLPALEEALAHGLHDAWRGVIENDPLASLFQSPGWCMSWYRAYAAAYTPYVIVVAAADRTVGIVPMAVDASTGALVFASHTMADYRDIVALPGFREQVASELVRHYLHLGTSAPLQVGWIDPSSDTAALLARICARRGLRQTVRRQPCWRWFPPAPSKPSAQKFLNWYKRNGAVSFEVIESEPDWVRFRDAFYRQHTLRQIQAGRPKIFDETHRAFYDALFHAPDIQSHVTAFCLNGEVLAGHFGYVWRGVLLFGPPSIRLEDEQRSPAIILLSWIIQNAERLGLRGFDLTIGDSDFKKRLGNQCVELSMVEIHASAATYHLQAARDGSVRVAKRLIERAAGPDAWKSYVKAAGPALAFDSRSSASPVRVAPPRAGSGGSCTTRASSAPTR